ncbi:putative ATP diphosphatase [Arabidopsis thaliana]
MAETKDPLELALEQLDKKYGKGATVMGDTVIKTERRKTGSLGLDIITGGGYGRGRMVEVYAPESSGKTTLAIHAMVESQKVGGVVAVVDTEHAFDRSYAEALGLDMSKVIFSQPSSGEEALEIADTLISTGRIDFCLIDSVAALVPQSELEGDMGDSKMGLHARLMSQACRKLTGTISKTKTVVFWTNQLREKIGVMFGNPETTTGGNALKFYASIRLDMRKKQGDKDSDGQIFNSKVTVKTVKNKLAPPFRVAEFNILFGKGIDKIGELIDWGVTANLIDKSGSWYSYNGTKLGQGENKVRELLEDNPELAEELEANIRKAYGID